MTHSLGLLFAASKTLPTLNQDQRPPSPSQPSPLPLHRPPRQSWSGSQRKGTRCATGGQRASSRCALMGDANTLTVGTASGPSEAPSTTSVQSVVSTGAHAKEPNLTTKNPDMDKRRHLNKSKRWLYNVSINFFCPYVRWLFRSGEWHSSPFALAKALR